MRQDLAQNLGYNKQQIYLLLLLNQKLIFL